MCGEMLAMSAIQFGVGCNNGRVMTGTFDNDTPPHTISDYYPCLQPPRPLLRCLATKQSCVFLLRLPANQPGAVSKLKLCGAYHTA